MEEKNYKRPNPRELKKKLIERDGSRCAYCGRELDFDSCTIEHVVPLACGGTSTMDNCIISCRECNIKAAGIKGYQFEQYVRELIEKHPSYKNVRANVPLMGAKSNIDIVCEKKTDIGYEKYIIEVKSVPSFTRGRIVDVINHLNECREQVADAKPVLAFPGEISEQYHELLRDKGVLVWDKYYLYQEFYAQIEQAEPSYISSVIKYRSSSVKEKDNHQVLIDKLKKCPAGKTNWGEYQTLVGEVLEFLFCPPLSHPLPQKSDATKNNRRDFILPNYVLEDSIWKFFRDMYRADFVVADAKNSAKPITKQDVLQMGNYLKPESAGAFGIIISRKGSGSSSDIAIREMWLYHHKMIVVLDDNDVEQMLLDRKNGNDPAELIRKKIEDFRLSI